MKKSALVLVLLLLISLPAGAEEYILLKGDLHCHSSFSRDSKTPYEKVLALVDKAGYDFIALTEHDTTEHLASDLSTDNVLVLPGIEMTWLGGHYNVYGLRDVKIRGNMARKGMESYLAELASRGALVQINHPNVKSVFSDYGYIDGIHTVEVVNTSVSADDYQTLQDWQALLCAGRKLVATAGSDAHGLSARKIVDNVFCKERTIEGVLEAVRAGRLYITTQILGPRMHLTCDGAIMGDSVQARAGQYAGLAISGLPLHSDVYVYTDKGLYSREAASGAYSLAIPTAGFSFIRCEVWQHGSGLIALSNPIYIEGNRE